MAYYVNGLHVRPFGSSPWGPVTSSLWCSGTPGGLDATLSVRPTYGGSPAGAKGRAEGPPGDGPPLEPPVGQCADRLRSTRARMPHLLCGAHPQPQGVLQNFGDCAVKEHRIVSL